MKERNNNRARSPERTHTHARPNNKRQTRSSHPPPTARKTWLIKTNKARKESSRKRKQRATSATLFILPARSSSWQTRRSRESERAREYWNGKMARKDHIVLPSFYTRVCPLLPTDNTIRIRCVGKKEESPASPGPRLSRAFTLFHCVISNVWGADPNWFSPSRTFWFFQRLEGADKILSQKLKIQVELIS